MASEVSRDSPDDALAMAIGRYVLGDMSLGKAAETVDMTRWEFEELLRGAGFTACYGPRSRSELDDERDVAIDLK